LLKMAMPISDKKLEIKTHVENVIVSSRDMVQPFQLKTRMPLFEEVDENGDSDGDGDEDEERGGILFDEDGEPGDYNEDEEQEEGILFQDEEDDNGRAEGEGDAEDDNRAENEGDRSTNESPGILFGEESSSAESSKSSSKSQRGGGTPKVFENKLYEKEPKLFLKKKEGQYDAYVRSCPLNYNRLPVILTDDEKKSIDSNYKGSYDVALPYGTSTDKKYWYMCPRYWCMPENRPITQEQIDEGQCGGPSAIIPSGEDAGPGKTIYEFTDKKEHVGKDGEYRQHYPGFLDKESHPNPAGCMPCCFKKINSQSQITRRQECGVNDEDINDSLIFCYYETNTDKEMKQFLIFE
jgi:hypothetical protein